MSERSISEVNRHASKDKVRCHKVKVEDHVRKKFDERISDPEHCKIIIEVKVNSQTRGDPVTPV